LLVPTALKAAEPTRRSDTSGAKRSVFGVQSRWDLKRWIVEEHQSPLSRFERSVATVVPLDRWRDPAGHGGSSIAFLVLHTAYHEDVAINAVAKGEEPLMLSWRARLGVDELAPHVGLAEAEDRSLTEALDLDALGAYLQAVHGSTASWLADLDVGALDDVPPSEKGLEAAGIAEAEVPWLYSMWSAQPVSFYVRWEATGHRMQHVGEMVSVRNRLGLSPF
jgi:hypothetical protein